MLRALSPTRRRQALEPTLALALGGVSIASVLFLLLNMDFIVYDVAAASARKLLRRRVLRRRVGSPDDFSTAA